ncbi:MAG: hypothetical protein FWC43_02825 [Planctomycetaceae bacterium]|nr:hypothetical protein [Planctomycetaceae bacterium]
MIDIEYKLLPTIIIPLKRTLINAAIEDANKYFQQGMGCGTCVAVCPSKSVDLEGFTEQQVYAQIESLLSHPETRFVTESHSPNCLR